MLQMNLKKQPKLLDEDQIRARRVPIEEAEISLGKAKNWHCHYCDSRFANETAFMRHHCEQKRRASEIISPLGQAAYGYYSEWMRVKKFSQQTTATFMSSKYYRAFINFAQLIIDANISRPEKYIAIMNDADLPPVLWCRESAYALYLDWMDKLQDPLDSVQESVNYLLDICEKEGTGLPNIFSHLGSSRVLSLIRQRRLSPWLLFCSSTFGTLLRSLDKSELSAFNAVVNSSFWATKFSQNRAIVENIKTIAKELEL